MTPLVLLALAAADPLPAAVRDHRAALAERPWDAAAQAGLEACRDRVAYPDPPDPALRVRPAPPAGPRHRAGPLDLLLASAAGSLLLSAGLAARLSVRPVWATPLAAVGGATLAAVAAAGWVVSRPVGAGLVVAEPTAFRAGNGTSYPARLTLPAGAEVAEVHRRGGWVQVEVAGGAAGWVPAAALLPASPAPAGGRPAGRGP